MAGSQPYISPWLFSAPPNLLADWEIKKIQPGCQGRYFVRYKSAVPYAGEVGNVELGLRMRLICKHDRRHFFLVFLPCLEGVKNS